MKTKLITSLKLAANALEDGTFPYHWNNASRCNCGIIACVITGKSPLQLKEDLPPGPDDKKATWKDRVGFHCPVSGMPENELLRTLINAGLTPRDFVDLEYLRNPDVRARMPKRFETRKRFMRRSVDVEREIVYSDQQDVIHYLRAWAELLTEQGAMDVSEAPTKEKASA